MQIIETVTTQICNYVKEMTQNSILFPVSFEFMHH